MPTQTANAQPSAAVEPGLDTWLALIRANARLLRELDEELREAHQVTVGDFDVLVNLANASPQRLRMCDLAGSLLLSPSGLSRRVDRLERAGLAERQRGGADGRTIEAALTPAGKRLLTRARATHRAGIRRLFLDQYDSEELETLRTLLRRLTPDP